jgi:NAD(P)-dependent dehydrogenase (short-subunit alcohol dehydrogenase family)
VDLGLNDSVVLITGAGGSLGRGLVTGFAREGARLFITDVDPDRLSRVVEEVRRSGGACGYRACDVTDSGQVKSVIAEVAGNFAQRIDVLINAAGIAHQGPVEEMSDQEWEEVFAVNCRGTFLFVREVVPFMKRRGSGRIVNFSSKSGKTGSPLLSAYSAAKAAIIGFTQAVALELAEHHITVNCVCPGLVGDTGMCDVLFEDYARNLNVPIEVVERQFTGKVPLKRLGRVEDVVDAVLYLASEGSSYVTGQALNVSGGREMH